MSLASDMKRCARRQTSAGEQILRCCSTCGFVDEVLKTLVKMLRCALRTEPRFDFRSLVV